MILHTALIIISYITVYGLRLCAILESVKRRDLEILWVNLIEFRISKRLFCCWDSVPIKPSKVK